MLKIFLIVASVLIVITVVAALTVATFLSWLMTNLRLGIDSAVNWIECAALPTCDAPGLVRYRRRGPTGSPRPLKLCRYISTHLDLNRRDQLSLETR
jgi:hypothetical protein